MLRARRPGPTLCATRAAMHGSAGAPRKKNAKHAAWPRGDGSLACRDGRPAMRGSVACRGQAQMLRRLRNLRRRRGGKLNRAGRRPGMQRRLRRRRAAGRTRPCAGRIRLGLRLGGHAGGKCDTTGDAARQAGKQQSRGGSGWQEHGARQQRRVEQVVGAVHVLPHRSDPWLAMRVPGQITCSFCRTFPKTPAGFPSFHGVHGVSKPGFCRRAPTVFGELTQLVAGAELFRRHAATDVPESGTWNPERPTPLRCRRGYRCAGTSRAVGALAAPCPRARLRRLHTTPAAVRRPVSRSA